MDEGTIDSIQTPHENKSRTVETRKTLSKECKTERTAAETENSLDKEQLRTEQVFTEIESIHNERESTSKDIEGGEHRSKEDHFLEIKINKSDASGDTHKADAKKQTDASEITMKEIIDLDNNFKEDLNPDTKFWVFGYFHRIDALFACQTQCHNRLWYSPARPFFLALSLTTLAWMYFLTYKLINFIKSREQELKKYKAKPNHHLAISGVLLLISHLIMLNWRFARVFPINFIFCLIAVWAIGTISIILELVYKWKFIATYFYLMTIIMLGCVVLAVLTFNFRDIRTVALIWVWATIVTLHKTNEYKIEWTLSNNKSYYYFVSLFIGMLSWTIGLLILLAGIGKPYALGPRDFFAGAYILYVSLLQLVIFIPQLLMDMFFNEE